MSGRKNSTAGGIARGIIIKEETKKRIDNYNKNPNFCKNCNSPILATYDKKLRDVRIKKFCSRSCAAKYNNIGVNRNPNGKGFQNYSKIDNFTDEEIINVFNNSKNITDFSKQLGFKGRIKPDNISVKNRLKNLNLSLSEIKKNENFILTMTKASLFERYTQWQTARSAIQKYARKIYESSNKPKQCICCGYSKHYEVAHIKAVSDFDDDALIAEINSENNLIALCPNHHWEYDNTDFDITPYLKGVS